VYKEDIHQCKCLSHIPRHHQTLTNLKMPSISYPIALVALAASSLADIHNVQIPSGFYDNGKQTDGVGSWYRASAGADATNGKSWCAYAYYNSDPIFAVVCNTSLYKPRLF
jgi:hypothetical protein